MFSAAESDHRLVRATRSPLESRLGVGTRSPALDQDSSLTASSDPQIPPYDSANLHRPRRHRPGRSRPGPRPRARDHERPRRRRCAGRRGARRVPRDLAARLPRLARRLSRRRPLGPPAGEGRVPPHGGEQRRRRRRVGTRARRDRARGTASRWSSASSSASSAGPRAERCSTRCSPTDPTARCSTIIASSCRRTPSGSSGDPATRTASARSSPMHAGYARVGGLVCWEHWMPLARQALHDSGEDIHIAAWPTVKEMLQIASRHYAFEGRCFVLAAGSLMRASALPPELEAHPSHRGERRPVRAARRQRDHRARRALRARAGLRRPCPPRRRPRPRPNERGVHDARRLRPL